MTFFEVKIKINRPLENGEMKAAQETYAIDAETFTEAEARITAKLEGDGEMRVTHEKVAQYTDMVPHPDEEHYYLVKYNLVYIDEYTGKERKTPNYVLIQANDMDHAKRYADEYWKESAEDYEIATIKETKILDVFTM